MVNEDAFRLKKDGTPTTRCFCRNPELIENYDKAIADKTQTWECHHRMEAVYSRKELIKYGLYYDREPHQLIFLTVSEHNKLKKGQKRGPHSEEHKRKIAEAHRGIDHTEETRKKIAESHKGKHLSEETKRKISEWQKSKHLSEETRKKISDANKGKPSSHKGKHLSKETKKKISEACKGKHWKLVDGKRIWY